MSQTNPNQARHDGFAALTDDLLDVLIIGGGIVGSGIARDAAMRQLRVGLVEQHDFAFGSSSRSSRMLHGGIRYLAQGHVGLVRQASVEKCIVGRIAPHLTMPLPFIFPTYRGTPWPRWKLRIGVRLYDLLCGGRNFGRSATLDTEQTRGRLPGICTDGLTGAVHYFDGATNDARLVIDTLRSAQRCGAVLCNYARVDQVQRDGDVWRCELCDTQSGASHRATSRVVVNACGPWADRWPRSKVVIRGTKGVHVVVDRSRWPIGDPPEAIMMTDEHRVAYAIPWGERIFVGTTDTDYNGPLEDVCTDPQDVAYLLNIVNRHFPNVQLSEADVLRTWAGVRPLVADARGRPSDVSRAHQIHVSGDGWIDVAGGKLTTYRLMAQQTVDRIGLLLGQRRAPSRTAEQPLLEPGQADGVSSIIPPLVTQAAVEHYCRNEWAMHLDDIMVRRTRWHHYHANTDDIAQQVLRWMAPCLGFDAQRQEHEIERYGRVLN